MDKLKYENFLKTYPGAKFPAWQPLEPDVAKEKKVALTRKLKLPAHADGLTVVKQLNALGEICKGFNAKLDKFRVGQVLSEVNIRPSGKIYLNWYRFDDIDQLNFSDLDMYFSDIWYPDLDDLDIFDNSLDWIISITHSGDLKLVRLCE